MKQGKLIVIVGPSGVGKGSILKEVFKQSNNLVYSISATTRSKRTGETDGIEYFFKTKQEFQEMIKNNEFLEWAQFVDNYYGTPKQYVSKNIELGNNVILEIEVQGARQIKEQMSSALFIAILPENIGILFDRLKKRSTESKELIEKRLERAKQELKEIEEADFFNAKIINREGLLEESIQEILDIIN